jgi:hypothetical protein
MPTWAAILGYVLGIAGAAGAALAVAFSKYRAKTNKEREDYITALEDRNHLLETINTRQAEELNEVKCQTSELKGQVQLLSQLVMGKCPWADIDPDSGRCRYCNRSPAFGPDAHYGGGEKR